MPILLWYLPFTMFSGACDIVFAELETQVNEPAGLDHVGPEEEATQHRGRVTAKVRDGTPFMTVKPCERPAALSCNSRLRNAAHLKQGLRGPQRKRPGIDLRGAGITGFGV
jgi:hypothetical protein